MAFVLGGSTRTATRAQVEDAERHVFGVVLRNAWSAGDVQAFESGPLGPFLGKSFATSIGALGDTTGGEAPGPDGTTVTLPR